MISLDFYCLYLLGSSLSWVLGFSLMLFSRLIVKFFPGITSVIPLDFSVSFFVCNILLYLQSLFQLLSQDWIFPSVSHKTLRLGGTLLFISSGIWSFPANFTVFTVFIALNTVYIILCSSLCSTFSTLLSFKVIIFLYLSYSSQHSPFGLFIISSGIWFSWNFPAFTFLVLLVLYT